MVISTNNAQDCLTVSQIEACRRLRYDLDPRLSTEEGVSHKETYQSMRIDVWNSSFVRLDNSDDPQIFEKTERPGDFLQRHRIALQSFNVVGVKSRDRVRNVSNGGSQLCSIGSVVRCAHEHYACGRM